MEVVRERGGAGSHWRTEGRTVREMRPRKSFSRRRPALLAAFVGCCALTCPTLACSSAKQASGSFCGVARAIATENQFASPPQSVDDARKLQADQLRQLAGAATESERAGWADDGPPAELLDHVQELDTSLRANCRLGLGIFNHPSASTRATGG